MIGTAVGVEGDLVVVVDFGVAKRSSSSSIGAAAAAAAAPVGRVLLDDGGARPGLATLDLSFNEQICSIDQKNAMKLLEEC